MGPRDSIARLLAKECCCEEPCLAGSFDLEVAVLQRNLAQVGSAFAAQRVQQAHDGQVLFVVRRRLIS